MLGTSFSLLRALLVTLALSSLTGCEPGMVTGPVDDPSQRYDDPSPTTGMCDEAYAFCSDEICQLSDSDGDGVVDPCDVCDNGDDNADADGDEVPDACDECPSDPAKQEVGACGCNVNDDDVDVDGVADCNDECPDDPAKFEEGYCGCGEPETDTDGDGVPDCADQCPDDPAKTTDNDHDGDGFADCVDQCPYNKDLQEPGGCGCNNCY